MIKEQLIAKLAQLFLSRISDHMRAEVVKIVAKLEVMAKKTSNPFDDIFIEALKEILDIK